MQRGCSTAEVSAKQICDADPVRSAGGGSLTHRTHRETQGANKNPLSLLFTVDSGSWKSGLTPNLLAFWVFRLQFVPWAGGIDCYHQYVTCLPHLGRRKTIFHPQTCLLSSCCRYYSNQDGLEIRLGTSGSWNAAPDPKAEATCAPFLVEHGHLLYTDHLVIRESPAAVETVQSHMCLHGGTKLSIWLCVQHKMASGSDQCSPSIKGPLQTIHSISLKLL